MTHLYVIGQIAVIQHMELTQYYVRVRIVLTLSTVVCPTTAVMISVGCVQETLTSLCR